ncbi:MAG: hypothetical protein JW884_04535 [Deltaproteobacteria bacterium]|nr:hypothetical protein [Deltaproteobacteria bacterium]
MGRLLRERELLTSQGCRICGKRPGEENEQFFYTIENDLNSSRAVREAYEWFMSRSDKDSIGLDPASPQELTIEERGYLFILEDFVERILARPSVCGSCFRRNSREVRFC